MEEDGVNETGSLPHFGDEESLRDARPVVPLAEVPDPQSSNKLLMAVALLCALSLGAGVALFIVQVSQPMPHKAAARPQPVNNVKTEDSSVAAATDEEEMLDLGENDESDSEAQTSKKKTNQKRPIPQIQSTNRDTPISSSPVVSENPPPEKPILVDQWEEKRSRRVREQRTSENVRHRDLFRIRDIFEGTRP